MVPKINDVIFKIWQIPLCISSNISDLWLFNPNYEDFFILIIFLETGQNFLNFDLVRFQCFCEILVIWGG